MSGWSKCWRGVACEELERVLEHVLAGSAEAKEQVVNVQFRNSVENTIDFCSEIRRIMALINVASREIQCKIVYYGTGYCGKTTNLQYIYCARSPACPRRSALHSHRKRAYAFLRLSAARSGHIHGFRVRFQLYTVPGQVLYERTRVAVLNGADGIVYVADSSPEKLEENFQSLIELETNMRRMGNDLARFPFVMQWNKRDLPGPFL